MLADHGVEFIVVDGQVEALMGSARVTYDVDLCDRRTSENLERLATALATLNLFRLKRNIGRPKDRESLLHLETIKRLREQEGLR